MSQKVESEVVRKFREEAKRLDAERAAKSHELRVASHQMLTGKVNEARQQARQLADSLKALEDSQHQDTAELRREELDLPLEFDEHAERLALEGAVSLESGIGMIKSVIAKLTTDINSLNRSVSDMEKLLAVAMKIKNPKLAKDSAQRAKYHIDNIIKTVIAINQKLLQVARFGKIDDNDDERINCLTEIQRKAFGIVDDVRVVGQFWAEGEPSETWLSSMHQQLKQTELIGEEIVAIWRGAPKL